MLRRLIWLFDVVTMPTSRAFFSAAIAELCEPSLARSSSWIAAGPSTETPIAAKPASLSLRARVGVIPRPPVCIVTRIPCWERCSISR